MFWKLTSNRGQQNMGFVSKATNISEFRLFLLCFFPVNMQTFGSLSQEECIILV